jgi:hypothetical protein
MLRSRSLWGKCLLLLKKKKPSEMKPAEKNAAMEESSCISIKIGFIP